MSSAAPEPPADALQVPPTGRATWVFQVALEGPTLEAFKAQPHPEQADAPSAWPLREALGLARLDHDFIEVFEAEGLNDYGFARYLTEANGMDDASVAPDAARLDALKGPVLLVYSAALPQGTNALSPRAPLRLVGRYTQAPEASLMQAPASNAAKPSSKTAKRRALPPRRSLSRRAIAAIVFSVAALTAALAALLLWGAL